MAVEVEVFHLQGGLVHHYECVARCDEPSCEWEGEMRRIQASAERDLTVHLWDVHNVLGRLF